MELTSKQRAQLRSLATNMDTIVHVGKDGIGDNLVKQVNDALEARELIKVNVQKRTRPTPPARPARRSAPACTPSRCRPSAIASRFIARRGKTQRFTSTSSEQRDKASVPVRTLALLWEKWE